MRMRLSLIIIIGTESRRDLKMPCEELEDFIREKVEKEKWTYRKLSLYLQQVYPSERGFSIRSLERFCSLKDIHRTQRLTGSELDNAVSEAIGKVSIWCLTCITMIIRMLSIIIGLHVDFSIIIRIQLPTEYIILSLCTHE